MGIKETHRNQDIVLFSFLANNYRDTRGDDSVFLWPTIIIQTLYNVLVLS